MQESSLEIRLLGPVEAARDGVLMPLGGKRQRALLALLALEPGRAVPAGRLVEELWHGEPPAGAETTLRSYVSRLRQALGRDAVTARAGGYALALEPNCLDMLVFERLLREGRDARERGAAGLASERLHAALGLWRGRALADVSEGGMLASEALRLDELRIAALEERVESDLALARHDRLVPELRALVQEHPLRERFWRQLVLALYRSGQQADALAAYREARTLLDSELGIEPGDELRGLERAILRHDVEQVETADVRHNLPAALATIVGRDGAVDELEELLRERRLITITGLGGTGKTRLALETARRQVPVWSDGVWLVDLTQVGAGDLVLGSVSAALGVPEGPIERPLEALLAHARTLELLVVLDNCEHVVTACADLVHAVLRGCPNVRVLATSRIPLGVRGELDYALDPLSAPHGDSSPEELERSPAVRLFLERAGAVRRDVRADDESLATIGAICRELDGLPLAIELAAARVKALSVGDIASRLDDRFRFLRAWQRVADPRHQTLQTTMDWSYGLLSEDEQRLLRRLATFAGGAALDSVAAICVDGDEDHAIELLGRLVDASLVRAERGDETRYRLLETVRQYAASRLEDDADCELVRRRHAEHYLCLAEAANLALDALGHGAQHHAPVLREQHNLRAAIDWATTADPELAVKLVLALENFWVTHAVAEAIRRFELLTPHAGELDTVLRARMCRDHAACLDVLQDFTAAQPLYEQSRELFREAGDMVAVAHLDFRVGVVMLHRGCDREGVRALWERSLETCRRADDRIGELQLLSNLGRLEIPSGDVERGRAMIEEALVMAHAEGWLWWEAQSSLYLAESVCAEGRCEDAERWARDALAIAIEMGNRYYARYALAVLARVAALRDERERALVLWASVMASEEPPGRFGRFDRAAYAAAMPDGPLPAPLALDEAAALVLSG